MENTNDLSFVKKVVDLENYTIKYEKVICKSSEEMLERKAAAEEEYTKHMRRLRRMTDMKYTFCEWMKHWLEEIAISRYRSSRMGVLTYSVNNALLPNVKYDMILSYVTGDYVNGIIKQVNTLGKTAAYTVRSAIILALTDAYNTRVITKDIAKEVKYITPSLPEVPQPSAEDVKRLLEAMKSTNFYLEVVLMALLGLRTGEVRGLKFSDFNREEQTLFIQRQIATYAAISFNDGEQTRYKRESVEKLPKSNASYRKLKIPMFIFDLLDERWERNNKMYQKLQNPVFLEYVAVSENGIVGQSTILSSLRKKTMAAGIPNVSCHSLRHFAGTSLLEKGVDLKNCAKFMGHTEATFFNVYAYVTEEAAETTREAIRHLDPARHLM